MVAVRRIRSALIPEIRHMWPAMTTIGDQELQQLLQDTKLTTTVAPGVTIEVAHHPSRLDLAAHLWESLRPLHDGNSGMIENDIGLWTWLALAHMPVIAPLAEGERRIGEIARWIPGGTDKFGIAYRHLLIGPFTAFAAHYDQPSRAGSLLGGAVDEFSMVARELSSRRDVLLSPAAVAVATHLYCEPSTGLPRKGSSTAGPGGVRRYVSVMMQLDLVWDLQTISPERLWALLPPEFDTWKAK